MKIHPSLKSANIPLLLKVRDAILAEPRKFDMFSFFERNKESPCGTTACIAGHAIAIDRRWSRLATGRIMDRNNSAHNEAMKTLRLNTLDADRLFYTMYWPNALRQQYHAATTPLAHAKVAARRINFFIRTGE